MQHMNEEQFRRAVDDVISKNGTVVALKQDVSVLKQDVSVLKQDVSVLKQDVSILKTEAHRQGLIQEDMQKDLKTIVQAITPLLKNAEKTQRLTDELQTHKDQIEVTQIALRDHIADVAIHRRA